MPKGHLEVGDRSPHPYLRFGRRAGDYATPDGRTQQAGARTRRPEHAQTWPTLPKAACTRPASAHPSIAACFCGQQSIRPETRLGATSPDELQTDVCRACRFCTRPLANMGRPARSRASLAGPGVQVECYIGFRFIIPGNFFGPGVSISRT